MLDAVLIIAPVFALILIGYLCGRYELLGRQSETGIADFTFKLAIPALLFRTIATSQIEGGAIAGVWMSYFGAVASVWLLTAALTLWLLRRPAGDGAAISLASTFGNTVMLGLPIALATFGEQAMATIAVILAIHAPVLWLAGMTHQALADRHSQAGRTSLLTALFDELRHNPIILAIIAGLLWRITGLELASPVDDTLALLARAGVPAALVALGLSLTRFQIKGQGPTLSLMLALKLVVMPVLAWLIATQVFALPAVTAGTLTLLAAMPTGANAYIFAEKQQRAINSASGSVALGTLLATLTAPLFVSLVSG